MGNNEFENSHNLAFEHHLKKLQAQGEGDRETGECALPRLTRNPGCVLMRDGLKEVNAADLAGDTFSSR